MAQAIFLVPLRMACAIALALWLVPPAVAGTVPYYHDFLGQTCLRAQDLEAAFLAGGKAVRVAPVCVEAPCEAELTRERYGRDYLGRPATDEEWDEYRKMYRLVCEAPQVLEELTELLPLDYDADSVTPVSDALFEDLATGWMPAASPWRPGTYQVWRPPGQRPGHDWRDRLPTSPFPFPDGPTGGGGSGPRPAPGPGTPGPPVGPEEVPLPVPIGPTLLGSLGALALLAAAARRPSRRG